MTNQKRSLQHYKLVFLLFLSTSYLSCKKEYLKGEIVKPEIQAEINAYLSGPHVSISNYSSIEAKLKALDLGPLSTTFRSNPAKEKLMAIDAPEVYDGFSINKDSVKIIQGEGHMSYVFQVKLSTPFSRSFQNLTIDESKEGVVAFVNTYIPTRKWIAESKSGHPGKFDGEISITYINLGDKIPLGTLESNPTNNSSVSKNQKISSLTAHPATSLAQVCVSTAYFYEIAYACGSGLHLPGEDCDLVGDGRAGYASASSVITTCTTVGGGAGDGSSGGGGNTTPNVPPGYNPCPTAPPVYSRIGAKGEKFAVREGTTPCDPLPPVVIVSDSELKENKLAAALTINNATLIDCALAKFFKPLASFKAPSIVNQRVSSLNTLTSRNSLFTDPFYIQQINNAAGYQINLDRFEVNVGMLPVVDGKRLTASEFLNYIRLHINNFIDPENTTFEPYNDPNDIFNDTQQWNSNHPTGSLLHLDIAGDNGSVIVTDYNENHWTVSTIRTPIDAQHPVSGNRSWGYSQDDSGFHFYVTGADRLTTPMHDLANIILNLPFSKADELWVGFQNKLTNFVNSNQGLAAVGTKITERPNYAALKDYFDGKITIEQLKALKACK